MESQGLIERVTLPPPAGSTVYRLTGSGAELEPIVRAIGRWGGRFMDKRGPGQQLSLGAYFVAIREWFRPERATGLREAYEFRVDGRVFEVRVDEGTCATSEGSASGAVAVFGMSLETLDQLFRGEVAADRAIADGRVKVDGDREALARFQAVFQSPAASAV
jgi:putative sterol carrier protein